MTDSEIPDNQEAAVDDAGTVVGGTALEPRRRRWRGRRRGPDGG
ncbi:hypothetical protein [Clavibacter tessellarius]